MFRWIVFLLLITLLGACDAGGTDEPEGLRVVATTTVLGDLARQIARDDAHVSVVLPTGADPHDYQMSSRQVADMHNADLVLANGLQLEAGFGDVLEAAADDGVNIVELAPLLDPLPFSEGGLDPHVWLDPVRMAEAARIIAAELAAIDPSIDWVGRADDYAAELMATDKEIVEILSAVPVDARKLITNHDALGYFAERYGFEVVGTVIPGGSTLADPSAAEVAHLAEVLDREGIRAIFAETAVSTALAEAVAAEVGDEVRVVELYIGSLGEPGTEADTLIGMLLSNAQRIAEALNAVSGTG